MSDEHGKLVEAAAEEQRARTFLLQIPDTMNEIPFIAFCPITLVGFFLWFKLGAIVAIAGCLLLLLATFQLLERLRPKLVVGADGILIRRFLSRRLIRYDEIVSVDEEQRTMETDDGQTTSWSTSSIVRIGLVGGGFVDLTTWRFGSPQPEYTGPLDAVGGEIMLEIQRQRDAWNARRGHAHEEALARRGRSGAAWLNALRRLTASTAGAYCAITVDRLRALLDDPHAPAVTRTAAAVALYRFDHERARQRLRIAAASVASPETRGGLERVADATDDVALAEALESLHDKDSRLERIEDPPAGKRRRGCGPSTRG
ncbi:PH domain-containing protein [Sorangium sp. So ce726]|uniref:PH domain-containing protein n=1 Tax=Sorangium sp. So ce726 TaxID=3133319 RepID=UPI003F62B7DB